MRNLNKTTANLEAMGLGVLLQRLKDNMVIRAESFEFVTLQQAQAVQRHLYNWLWFHPEIKVKITLRLDTKTRTLTILPKVKRETRGRKPRRI